MENKETLRVERGLINKVVFSGLILILFIGIFLFGIYPDISQISDKKDELLNKITYFEKISKKGLTYDEIQSVITDEKIKKTLSKVGKDFYENNLSQKDNTKIDYIDFLKEKEKFIQDLNKSQKISLRDQKISKVLPSYTEGYSDEGSMTDLTFVNYVENLLRTFGLKTSSKIGIDEVTPIEEKTDKKDAKNITNQIFYIPLKLELQGKKSDMIDFIYFLQNVGKIQSVDNENIVFYNDSVLNRTISGQNRTYNYNLYENYLVDIASIKMDTYIDDSTTIRPGNSLTPESFIYFIRNTAETDESFKTTLDLKFYVKGLPIYKLEIFINNVINKYREMVKNSNNLLNKLQNTKTIKTDRNILGDIASLKTIIVYLGDLDSKVKKLDLSLKQKNNLNSLYKDASSIQFDLENINTYLSKISAQEAKK